MENKKAIIAQFSDKFNGIFIDPSFSKNKLGNIQKINYPNFKYIGTHDIEQKETGEKRFGVHCIQITNLPKGLINEVSNTINEIINDSDKNIANCIDEILDYFKRLTLKGDRKKELLGDLAEAVFVLKSLEQGINLLPYFRNEDFGTYDITVGEKNIEIKHSSIEKNDFIMTHEQLTQDEKRFLVIVKFKAVKARVTILDVYKMISSYGTLPNLLVQKQSKWNSINEICKNECGAGEQDIINDFSVNLEKCKISLFDNKNLPVVDIIKNNALKKVQYTINCTDNELEPIENLYSKLNLK